MQVATRRRNRFMPQRIANGREIGAASKRMRPVRVTQEVRRNRQFIDAGKARGALDAFPRVRYAHRKDAVFAERFICSKCLEFLPCAPREADYAGFSVFPGDVRNAIDKIAPAK